MLKTYETLFIIHPDVEESEMNKVITVIQDVITNSGGTIIKLDKWGKRQLAYQIQKKHDGFYVLMYFEAPPTVIIELNRRFRLTDSVMRHLIIQLEKKQFEEAMSGKKPSTAILQSSTPKFYQEREEFGDDER